MKKLEQYDWQGRGPRSSFYNWDQLFDGGIYKLRERDDINGKVQSFRTTVYAKAKERQLLIRTDIIKDGDNRPAIIIQAFPKPE